jgi:hypothetical protein
MILQKKINKSSFYKDFVNILNGVLQLSNREAEVFSLLLFYSDTGYEYNVNSKQVRAGIISALGISEANLSRYLGIIKVKNLIIKNNNKWVINPNIKPNINDEEVNITFALKLYNDEFKEVDKINGVYTKEDKS